MVNSINVNELYKQISTDLTISKFSNESDYDFHCRLVYSALAIWILTMTNDKDFDYSLIGNNNIENDSISKNHVTMQAEKILNSYLMVDNELKKYFKDPLATILQIEDAYSLLGYVNSGHYRFHKSKSTCVLFLGGKYVHIDSLSQAVMVAGIGRWTKNKKDSLSLDEYLGYTSDALDSFNGMLKNLTFQKFEDDLSGREIYDLEHNSWQSVNDKYLSKHKYTIAQVGTPKVFELIKNEQNVLSIAKFPTIYDVVTDDPIFKKEIWRMIFGLSVYESMPRMCTISNIDDDSFIFIFNGYVLPSREMALIRLFSWPLEVSNNIFSFVTRQVYRDALIEILNKLSIEVEEK